MVANVLLLNLLWFASVLGAANAIIWPAMILLFILLALNYFYIGMQPVDFKIICFSVLAGVIIDGIMMGQGLVIYAYNEPDLGWIPPVWIMILWVGLGASIRLGMQWLINHPKIGGLIMLVGAPLSYVSAGKLGATTLPHIWLAMVFIGVSWLIYFLLVVYMMKHEEFEDAVA